MDFTSGNTAGLVADRRALMRSRSRIFKALVELVLRYCRCSSVAGLTASWSRSLGGNRGLELLRCSVAGVWEGSYLVPESRLFRGDVEGTILATILEGRYPYLLAGDLGGIFFGELPDPESRLIRPLAESIDPRCTVVLPSRPSGKDGNALVGAGPGFGGFTKPL